MIKDFFSQFSGLLGSAFAAACCLGLPVALSALGTLSLGFIVQNACKGQGWQFMPEKACFANGGERFEGSAGDPAATTR